MAEERKNLAKEWAKDKEDVKVYTSGVEAKKNPDSEKVAHPNFFQKIKREVKKHGISILAYGAMSAASITAAATVLSSTGNAGLAIASGAVAGNVAYGAVKAAFAKKKPKVYPSGIEAEGKKLPCHKRFFKAMGKVKDAVAKNMLKTTPEVIMFPLMTSISGNPLVGVAASTAMGTIKTIKYYGNKHYAKKDAAEKAAQEKALQEAKLKKAKGR